MVNYLADFFAGWALVQPSLITSNLSQITSVQPGDNAHALNLVVPCNAPGLKNYSRRSYARAANSIFDYPLATRFDETDLLVVFDDVFVP